MFGGKAPLRLAAQKSKPHAPLALELELEFELLQTQMTKKATRSTPAYVVKSAKAGLREKEARRAEIPCAERRPAVQAK
jgi:hypothetical protein